MTTTMAQAEATRAALERGEWVAGEPAQARAQVPVKIPGGPIIRRVRLVWRGRIHRRDAATGLTAEYCPHNHAKRGPAAACGQAAARRRNRELAQPGAAELAAAMATVRGRDMSYRLAAAQRQPGD